MFFAALRAIFPAKPQAAKKTTTSALAIPQRLAVSCFEFSASSISQMRVLGIDPGSETLGWGVVDGTGTRYKLVHFGVVKSNPRTAFSKRLAGIYAAVGDVMAEHSPDVLSVEDTFYAVNVGVALKLGQVRGIMLLLAEQRGLGIAEYAPRLVKQTVTGYGNADKTQVGQMVKTLLGLKAIPTPHDAADALAIAICHFHHAKFNDKIAKAR